MSRGAYLLDLGLVPYQEAWDVQRSLAGAVPAGAAPDPVIVLEDAAVTTIARELGRPAAVDEVRPLAHAAVADVFDLTLEPLPADDGHGLWVQPVHGQLAAKR